MGTNPDTKPPADKPDGNRIVFAADAETRDIVVKGVVRCAVVVGLALVGLAIAMGGM
jgi:hypothetical protein